MTAEEALILANTIANAIEIARIQTSTETLAQDCIAGALELGGWSPQREVKLDAASRPDFMVRGVAIEVKVKGEKRAIWRQVERYATHPRVDAIVLATSVPFPRDLPAVNGKPVILASLSRGWL